MKRTAALLLLLACPQRAAAAAAGAGFYDTSEFLIGKVAVNIVFVQSDGTIDVRTETNGWTLGKRNAVSAGVQNAMTWWAARNSAAGLTFVHNNTTITTGYEPINRPSSDEDHWIAQVMSKLGYNEADYSDRVFHYNNDTRLTYSADWSFTIFMVDSDKNLDGKFADGYFAYAYVGGPFIVMTYDNDSYGISDIAAVTAHETGHIFYALDEYAASKCATSERAGYLNGPNTNCENGGPGGSCIMIGDTPPYYAPAVCQHTARMLGWSDDSPANGVLDLIDLPPTTALNPFTPDPTNNTSPVYYGMAHSTAAYHNSNTYAFFWDTSRAARDITINRIASVEYKVDGGDWQAATPRDGAFDQNVDSFTFIAASLASGPHTMQARARDIFGFYDATPVSDPLTVDLGQAQDIAYINDGMSVDIDYTRSKSSLSANWGASYHDSGINRYEYAAGTTPGTSDAVAWDSAGTALSVTKTGLFLAEGTDYYFSVRAYPNSGAASGITTSDGLRVDTTSPTATVLITSPEPAKTGAFSAELAVDELNAVAGSPQLGFTTSGGFLVPLTLSYAGGSKWTASGYIESYYSTGTASFQFSASDPAGNTGTYIASGDTFVIDPSLSGSAGGGVSNSDGGAAAVPAGAYAGTLYVSISTVPSSAVSGADASSPDSRKIFSKDLAREFSARNAAWSPVTAFLAPLTITMSYPDADNDGRIDMDLLKETTAWLYYLDPASGRWVPLTGVVRNTAANTVSAEVSHFSVYSVRSAGPSAADIGALKAYPNPCDFRSVAALTIEGIPADAAGARVYIYNEAGELVRTLARGDGINGLNLAAWDGRLKGGARAASGLYIYLVKSSNYEKGGGKFFIVW